MTVVTFFSALAIFHHVIKVSFRMTNYSNNKIYSHCFKICRSQWQDFLTSFFWKKSRTVEWVHLKFLHNGSFCVDFILDALEGQTFPSTVLFFHFQETNEIVAIKKFKDSEGGFSTANTLVICYGNPITKNEGSFFCSDV